MAGLLDFLQSASNAAASNVSGPVDALAWLLKKAGVDVGEPVGGSQWMERQGLTRPVQQGAARVAGETAGLLAPIAAAAKAPQIAKGLLQMGENAAAPRTLNPQTGAIVWHGSPHKFDRFDSSKIGTGEGAQAYGHGLYLAESPDVAKSYQATLSGRGDAAGAAAKYAPARQFNAEEIAAIHRAATGDDPLNLAARRLGYRQASLRDVDEAALTKAIAEVREQAAGSLYKVDLPDPVIARMLDWDKPIRENSNAMAFIAGKERERMRPILKQRKQALAELPKNSPARTRLEHQIHILEQEIASTDVSGIGSLTGKDYYQYLWRRGMDPKEQANMFKEAGIPGIRYLDGGSRGAGSGTSNFVVFPGEENILTILERNGIPLR